MIEFATFLTQNGAVGFMSMAVVVEGFVCLQLWKENKYLHEQRIKDADERLQDNKEATNALLKAHQESQKSIAETARLVEMMERRARDQ